NQILDPPDDTPVPCRIHLSLITGVKPAVIDGLSGFLRTVPVAGKDVGSTRNNLAIPIHLHFDATDGRTNTPRYNVSWIIHRADRSRLGEPIHLQHRNPEHPEIELCFNVQRRRPTNQSFQILPDHLLADGGKYQRVRQCEPEPTRETRLPFLLANVSALRAAIDREWQAAHFPKLFVHCFAHTFE